MDVESAVERLEGQLRAVATPERAASEKRYLKSDLAFLGATVWQIRAAVKEIVREHRYLDHENLVNLVEALWAEPVQERRMASVILLRPPRESPQRR